MIQLSITEARALIQPLALFVLAMTIYAIFIFRFYRLMAKKDIIELDFTKFSTSSIGAIRKFVHFILYVVEYILLFPVISFFAFAVLSVLLSFLSKDSSINSILLVSMAVVGAVRLTSYYNEDLSKDLAKMLPFALLGVFLVDTSFFSIEKSISLLFEIPSQLNLLIYYLVFAVGLEFTARLVYGIVRLFTPHKSAKKV